jgi:hypothetical protein
LTRRATLAVRLRALDEPRRIAERAFFADDLARLAAERPAPERLAAPDLRRETPFRVAERDDLAADRLDFLPPRERAVFFFADDFLALLAIGF